MGLEIIGGLKKRMGPAKVAFAGPKGGGGL